DRRLMLCIAISNRIRDQLRTHARLDSSNHATLSVPHFSFATGAPPRRQGRERLVTCLSCEQGKEGDQLFRRETRPCRSIPANITAKPHASRVRHITHGAPASATTRTCSVWRPLPSRAACKPAAFALHAVKLPTLIHRFCFRWLH